MISDVTRAVLTGPWLRPRRRRAALVFECLEQRKLLASYIWRGNGALEEMIWSDVSDWRVNDEIPANPPGVDDDVTLPAGGRYRSVVDRDFTIRSLHIDAGLAGGDVLLLNGDLTVAGGNDSLIAGGDIASDNKSLTFVPSEFKVTWTGGALSTSVHIGDATPFEIKDAGQKKLDGKLYLSGFGTWDGIGHLNLAQGAQFWITPDGDFTLSGNQDASVDMLARAVWINQGGFVSDLPAGNKLTFGNAGSVQNFKNFDGRGGAVVTGQIQNSGTITLASGTALNVGDGQTPINLWPQVSPDSKSIIQGPGTTTFLDGSTVNLGTGTSQVGNVKDRALKTTGEGNLLITGRYELGGVDGATAFGNGDWEGGGRTQVGSDEFPGAELWIFNSLSLDRKLDNYTYMVWWSSLNPSPVPLFSHISIGANGWIGNQASGRFEILGTGSVEQLMDGPIGGGAFWNAGYVKHWGVDTTIGVPYIPVAVPTFPMFPLLQNAHGKLQVNKKQVQPVGRIQNDQDAMLVFGDGVDQSGGEIDNASAMQVFGDYTMSGGTLVNSGGTADADGTVDLTGNFDQSGGQVRTSMAPIHVMGTYSQSDGELISSGGRVTVDSTLDLSAGTADFSGTLDGESLVADSIHQTGGTLVMHNTSALDVTGAFD